MSMSSRSNSQFLMASVTEFISVWALRGEASLNFVTNNGVTPVAFNCHLGHPGAAHSLPPPSAPPASSPPHRPRHRGPTERERNRHRAARHQAAISNAAAPASTATASVSPTDSVVSICLASSKQSYLASTVTTASVTTVSSNSTASVKSSSSSLSSADSVTNAFSCDLCDFEGVSSVGLKIHTSRKHDYIPQVDGDISEARNADCWWVKGYRSCLKTFQTYKDVLIDIEEAPLSQAEKCTERDKKKRVGTQLHLLSSLER